MRFTTALSVAGLAAIALADDIAVDVGKTPLQFSPSTVTAKKGDNIKFTFYPKGHSVTQSTFAAPCSPLAGGQDSQIVPVADVASATQNFTYTVEDDTKPVWFYCKQTGHCAQGMVFSVNPDKGNDTTQDAFVAAAKATGGSSSGNGTSTNGTSTGAPNSTDTSSSPASTGSGKSAASALTVSGGAVAAVAALFGLML